MLILPGSNALSAFRNSRLLSQIQSIDSSVIALEARFVHFVDEAAALEAIDLDRLKSLLTYGEPFGGTEKG